MSRALFRIAAVACIACLFGPPALAGELVVEIKESYPQDSGRLTVYLFDSEAAWQGKRDALAARRVHPDGSSRQLVRFDGLRAGRYGVVVLHDRDGNGKFDVGPLGIPRDGYGFSNNPFVFKRPGFDKVAFELSAADKQITVQMK